MSSILFLILKLTGILRVSQEIEEAGMDVSKHGGTAYDMEGAKAASIEAVVAKVDEWSRAA